MNEKLFRILIAGDFMNQHFLDCATYLWTQENQIEKFREWLEDHFKEKYSTEELKSTLDKYFSDEKQIDNAIAVAKFMEE